MVVAVERDRVCVGRQDGDVISCRLCWWLTWKMFNMETSVDSCVEELYRQEEMSRPFDVTHSQARHWKHSD